MAAGTKAITTSLVNSLDSKIDKLNTEAPIDLRTPISLVRCSVVNAANANNPKQAMKIAKLEKTLNNYPYAALHGIIGQSFHP